MKHTDIPKKHIVKKDKLKKLSQKKQVLIMEFYSSHFGQLFHFHEGDINAMTSLWRRMSWL